MSAEPSHKTRNLTRWGLLLRTSPTSGRSESKAAATLGGTDKSKTSSSSGSAEAVEESCETTVHDALCLAYWTMNSIEKVNPCLLKEPREYIWATELCFLLADRSDYTRVTKDAFPKAFQLLHEFKEAGVTSPPAKVRRKYEATRLGSLWGSTCREDYDWYGYYDEIMRHIERESEEHPGLYETQDLFEPVRTRLDELRGTLKSFMKLTGETFGEEQWDNLQKILWDEKRHRVASVRDRKNQREAGEYPYSQDSEICDLLEKACTGYGL